MTRFKDIPLLVEELTEKSAAAISGGLSVEELQQPRRLLSKLPWIDQRMNRLPIKTENETQTDNPFILEVNEAKELATEEKELANELIETIKEKF